MNEPFVVTNLFVKPVEPFHSSFFAMVRLYITCISQRVSKFCAFELQDAARDVVLLNSMRGFYTCFWILIQ